MHRAPKSNPDVSAACNWRWKSNPDASDECIALRSDDAAKDSSVTLTRRGEKLVNLIARDWPEVVSNYPRLAARADSTDIQAAPIKRAQAAAPSLDSQCAHASIQFAHVPTWFMLASLSLPICTCSLSQ